VHYPEIVERRELVRIRLGLNDNLLRGARRQCKEQYAEAVEHLRNFLRIWHPELIIERRGVKCNRGDDIKISDTKHYLKSTAAKYADAIKRLKESGLPSATVAKELGLHPETFRVYLHEHEPELAAGLGMTTLPNGKRISARNVEKYSEAIRLYETTSEPLSTIAHRLGLVYNSLFSFVHRNYPESIEKHNRLRPEN